MQYYIIINDIALIMHYRALLKGSDNVESRYYSEIQNLFVSINFLGMSSLKWKLNNPQLYWKGAWVGASHHRPSNAEFLPYSIHCSTPGLDDDGSGVMVLFEILRVIVETGYKPQKNVRIMAYASEEVGLLGSDQIAEDYNSEGLYLLNLLGGVLWGIAEIKI